MKHSENRRKMAALPVLALALLLVVPAAGPAQDDTKGTVNLSAASMATAAELLKLGNTWLVTGCCGWSGTWTRRPGTNVFDTKWRHTNGTPVEFVVQLKTWNKATNEITLYQADNSGTYRAFLANNGASIVRGTTSFYPAGATWSAVVYQGDEKGPVNSFNR